MPARRLKQPSLENTTTRQGARCNQFGAPLGRTNWEGMDSLGSLCHSPLPAREFNCVLESFDHVELQAQKEVVSLGPVPCQPGYQTFTGHTARNGRRQVCRKDETANGWTTPRAVAQLLAQNQIQLVSRGVREEHARAEGFHPQANFGAEADQRPIGPGSPALYRRTSISKAIRPRPGRVPLVVRWRRSAHLEPEVCVPATCLDMAPEFMHPRGAGVFPTEMLEKMQALLHQNVGGRQRWDDRSMKLSKLGAR